MAAPTSAPRLARSVKDTARATVAGRQAGARDLVALFTIAVLSLCGLLAVLPPQEPQLLPVVLVLALTGWAAYRNDRSASIWPLLVLIIVPLATPWAGDGQSPLLPALLCAGLMLGLEGDGRRLGASCAGCLALFAVQAAPWNGHLMASDRSLLVSGTQWTVLSFAVGLVARWARRLAVPAAPADPGDSKPIPPAIEREAMFDYNECALFAAALFKDFTIIKDYGPGNYRGRNDAAEALSSD